MNKSRQPKLLDIVAVLNAPADAEVEVGDVGTVVDGRLITGQNPASSGPAAKVLIDRLNKKAR